jgi:hypothetical protein
VTIGIYSAALLSVNDDGRFNASMVALPSNMREAAFLQLKAAYARLCAVHAKVQDRWNESAYSPDEFRPRHRAINELRSELRQAHSDFDAALRLFFREIPVCPACRILNCAIHGNKLLAANPSLWF